MYEWTLPTGWRTNDNKTGTFTTSSYSISVIPAAGSGGQVKVRGLNQECSIYSSPRVNFYSNYSTLTVTREPQVGAIIASKTNLHCGDRDPVNLSVPTVTGATSYTWSLPQGWTISGSASGNSISAIPSGTNGGQVSVAANITCTTPTKAVNSKPITINYNSNLPALTFSNAPYDIGNTASSYSITPVAGASGYTWEASPNILINGQLSPLQSTSTAVAITQRPGHSGAGWVKVTANSALCSSSSVTKNVWVGQPEILYFSYFGSAKYPTCPYEQHTFAPVYSNGYQGQPTRYRWTVGNVSSHGDLTGSTLTVTAAGFNFSSRMSIGLEVETPLGWTQQFVMLYEIRDCDNGAEPMFSPNPVTEDEFTLELSGSSDESYSYTLYDLQGNQRLSGKAKGKKAKVSTKDIPAGTYMLRVEHNGKSTTKRMIIEK
ncbi:T9SS type A sorting domain-containing protein [Pontibacter sp. FD36]|uniref:T9SS type A sorting domain-containing protein n=1 Tax=Pontibacter sp. FD36 TaxID=2789860 RepID=UPI0018ABA646|nr:T9SS type A sorting domain-containing protein [Pontibacter sp. FD36]MBF8964280.1 T9SS type A sorting domain-containing protein [Pontibacter sp. FD36]